MSSGRAPAKTAIRWGRASLASLLLMALVQRPAGGGCAPFPAPDFEQPPHRAFRGEYTNVNYLYGVTIPPDLTGIDGPAPAPHHGFGIVLSRTPRAYLWVDASYNVLEWESPREAALTRLRSALQDVDRPLDLTLEATRLGPLEAMQFDLSYTCEVADGAVTPRLDRLVVAIDGGTVFTIGLDTDAGRVVQDGATFAAIVTSFRLTTDAPPAAADRPSGEVPPPQNASGSSPPQ